MAAISFYQLPSDMMIENVTIDEFDLIVSTVISGTLLEVGKVSYTVGNVDEMQVHTGYVAQQTRIDAADWLGGVINRLDDPC